MLTIFDRSATTTRSFASDMLAHAEAAPRQARPSLPPRLRLLAGTIAEVDQHRAHAAPVAEQTRLGFENAMVAIILRNTWFFSAVVEQVAAQVKEIVIPIFRKVYLYKKYPNCFPEPSVAETALFNCFFYSSDARTGYFAYRSDVRHGIPLPGMMPVPKTSEEIQGFIDYYSGHVFGHLGQSRAIEEKWTAIRDFGLFLKQPSLYSAKKLSLENVEFIKPELRKLIAARIEECRSVTQNDFGGSQFSMNQNHVHGQDRDSGALSSAREQVKGELHPFGGPLVRRERATPLALAPIDPHHEIRDRKVGFFWQMAMEEKNDPAMQKAAAQVREVSPTARADSNAGPEAVMLVAHFLGGVGNCADLQKISMLSFACSFPQGGTSFHETAAVAKKFGLPYVDGHYGSAIPGEWYFRLPELERLKHKFPDLM